MKYKKIQIDSSLEIEAYEYGWMLHNSEKGIKKTTYHCRIEHVCQTALDIMAKKCDNLHQIANLMEMASKNMAKEVQKELEL